MVLDKGIINLDSVLASVGRARENLALIEQRFLGDKQLITDMYKALDDIETTADGVHQLIASGDFDKAIQKLSTESREIINSGIETSQGIVDFALNKALDFNNSASVTLRNAVILLIILLVLMVAVCVAIATILSRSISRPVAQITGAAKKLAAGSLDIEISYRAKDELGTLAEAFRGMSSSLKAVIKDVDLQLGAMGQGDFTVSSQAEYIGDYASIKNAIVNINKSLSNTLNQINQPIRFPAVPTRFPAVLKRSHRAQRNRQAL